jgi:selenium metabolism protein YedF
MGACDQRREACAGSPGAEGAGSGTVVLLAADTVGHGSDELGGILMRAFVKTLREARPRPRWLLLLNAGVRLACEGSPLLDDLRALAEAGVELRACGTCLDYYHLKDKLRVGSVGNMFDIVNTLLGADRVIRP